MDIVTIFNFLLGITCFIFSFRHFKEKGFLLNNSYIYVSKSEREKMNKKPFYRQTAIVLLTIGIIQFWVVIYNIFKVNYFFEVFFSMIVLLVTYVIVSSVFIAKKYN